MVFLNCIFCYYIILFLFSICHAILNVILSWFFFLFTPIICDCDIFFFFVWMWYECVWLCEYSLDAGYHQYFLLFFFLFKVFFTFAFRFFFYYYLLFACYFLTIPSRSSFYEQRKKKITLCFYIVSVEKMR